MKETVFLPSDTKLSTKNVKPNKNQQTGPQTEMNYKSKYKNKGEGANIPVYVLICWVFKQTEIGYNWITN